MGRWSRRGPLCCFRCRPFARSGSWPPDLGRVGRSPIRSAKAFGQPPQRFEAGVALIAVSARAIRCCRRSCNVVGPGSTQFVVGAELCRGGVALIMIVHVKLPLAVNLRPPYPCSSNQAPPRHRELHLRGGSRAPYRCSTARHWVGPARSCDNAVCLGASLLEMTGHRAWPIGIGARHRSGA
jgi:hypothetical protein